MKISGKNGQRVLIWIETLYYKNQVDSMDGFYDIVDYGDCFAIVKGGTDVIVEMFSKNMYAWRMQPNEIGQLGQDVRNGLLVEGSNFMPSGDIGERRC